jgi:hypothetical protein
MKNAIEQFARIAQNYLIPMSEFSELSNDIKDGAYGARVCGWGDSAAPLFAHHELARNRVEVGVDASALCVVLGSG